MHLYSPPFNTLQVMSHILSSKGFCFGLVPQRGGIAFFFFEKKKGSPQLLLFLDIPLSRSDVKSITSCFRLSYSGVMKLVITTAWGSIIAVLSREHRHLHGAKGALSPFSFYYPTILCGWLGGYFLTKQRSSLAKSLQHDDLVSVCCFGHWPPLTVAGA